MDNSNSPQQGMQDARMPQDDRGAAEKGGRSFGGGGGGGAGGRGRFGRRKVCPFIMDKTLVLDYKNLKVVYRFVTETGKIVPRHVSGVSAKNQRKLAKHIKRARTLGLVAPLIGE
jgi:small subunit ribosomal protein S18